MTRVAILGGSGYTALELIKILLRHPQVKIEAVNSRQEGTPKIADLHPSLFGRLDLVCEPYDAATLKRRGVECAFGCLPHGVSAEAVKPLLEQGIRVVDLSADYRLRNPATFAQWYGDTHHDTTNLAHAVYGLPEVHGEIIPTARLVANPGCYPQTAILGLAPLVANGLIETTGIIVNSASGVSGGGRTPKLAFHYPECNENFTAYNVGKHRHQPEIEQGLGDVAGQPVDVIFTPHLVPMDRGILSTIYATPTKAVTESELLVLYRNHFAKAPFVRVRDSLPATKDTAHTNFLDVTVRVVKNKIIVLSAIDNLVRGASGVAVQNFNLMFGYDERTGLL
ncbi:N-acetyl-gamma-glutamyl-phosphate reductase [Zavarzinella formosa]|uniref:N-acetyl-gamma-glutamyl-phosphate reductase n=1 Tax=Zavarzinella formosa TaxID=360055 RepID=UPI0003180634|nr:N-acetyl-gamma-glutamyl-phosphate reductase [Zavarzinella formosa]